MSGCDNPDELGITSSIIHRVDVVFTGVCQQVDLEKELRIVVEQLESIPIVSEADLVVDYTKPDGNSYATLRVEGTSREVVSLAAARLLEILLMNRAVFSSKGGRVSP